MSVTAKDQYEDLLIERNELRRELEKAERQCAEMRDASRKFTDEIWAHIPEEQWRNPPVHNALMRLQDARNSSDCGKDYLPKAELERTPTFTQKHGGIIDDLKDLNADLGDDMEGQLLSGIIKRLKNVFSEMDSEMTKTVPRMEAYADTMVEECNRKWREKTKQLVAALEGSQWDRIDGFCPECSNHSSVGHAENCTIPGALAASKGLL